MKKIVAFDLDGTLALSKQPLTDEMAGLIAQLLTVAQVAVISGGDWPQFDKQVASRLPAHADLRSEEHTSELQSLMRISYAVFCLKKKKNNNDESSRKNKEIE